MRDLLSSFYALDPSISNTTSSISTSFDNINSTSFDADQYMDLMIKKSNLEVLLQRHVQMAAEIKKISTQTCKCYENYNKFISATNTIKIKGDRKFSFIDINSETDYNVKRVMGKECGLSSEV
ncbi:unnamed protein product [Arabis nemorensis]|uniref:Vacuolar protein sorting-associated protein 51 homolog n=1 Tax=Arabis nemorensis TaxID=586526 RepID=A0A565C0J6_9BRAS|nr:unnamed protein product [Arabis nemorensis]